MGPDEKGLQQHREIAIWFSARIEIYMWWSISFKLNHRTWSDMQAPLSTNNSFMTQGPMLIAMQVVTHQKL